MPIYDLATVSVYYPPNIFQITQLW